MQVSARNVFQGHVVKVATGPIMANVKVDIGGGHIVTALITAESALELGLAEGAAVSVVVKSTDVLLATD